MAVLRGAGRRFQDGAVSGRPGAITQQNGYRYVGLTPARRRVTRSEMPLVKPPTWGEGGTMP
jgi:hypothetical protein